MILFQINYVLLKLFRNEPLACLLHDNTIIPPQISEINEFSILRVSIYINVTSKQLILIDVFFKLTAIV